MGMLTPHPTLAALAPVRLLLLAAGLVVFGVLLRLVAPARRRHLRHTALLFLLSLVTVGGAAGCEWLGWGAAAQVLDRVSCLGQLLCEINFAIILLFDLLLPLVRASLPGIVADLVIGVAYFFAFLHSLHGAGMNLSGLIATSAVVSGVIGLSLAPTVGNILGGVALQLDNSIHEGDWIQLDANTQGWVRHIRWRHTVIETRNWDTLIVPNATLLSATITVLGKRTAAPLQRRYWVYFNVDFRHAPGKVIAAVNEALQCAPIDNVALEPKPHAICLDLAREGRDSFAYYAVRYWLTDLAADDATSSVIRERIYTALERAGIPLSVPGLSVFLSQDDQQHKERKEERELRRRVELLQQLQLFRGFTGDELLHLSRRLRHAPFAGGEAMTQQGREAHWLYILAEGAAEVRIRAEGGGDQRVTTLTAPSFFGEMGVMTGAPRQATVIATAPSLCYRLDKEAFQTILKERKELAALLSEVLAERRSQLDAAREHLDAAAKERHRAQEQVRMLRLIEQFFGLNSPDEG